MPMFRAFFLLFWDQSKWFEWSPTFMLPMVKSSFGAFSGVEIQYNRAFAFWGLLSIIPGNVFSMQHEYEVTVFDFRSTALCSKEDGKPFRSWTIPDILYTSYVFVTRHSSSDKCLLLDTPYEIAQPKRANTGTSNVPICPLAYCKFLR